MQDFNEIDQQKIRANFKSKFGEDIKLYFAGDVPSNTFFSDKEKINDDIYSNQFPIEHIESNKGVVLVKCKSKYGMFDDGGREVLPIEYQKIIWISKDRVMVCKDGKYGLSDTKGACLIPCEYDKLRPIPFVKEYGYGYDEVYRQCAEEVKLIAAQSKGEEGYTDTGFNMNGEMVIRPCHSIYPGEYYSLIDTWGEFPYICAEVYTNLILELFPRRYFLLDIKNIGFDYSRYIEQYEDCDEQVCAKVLDDLEQQSLINDG